MVLFPNPIASGMPIIQDLSAPRVHCPHWTDWNSERRWRAQLLSPQAIWEATERLWPSCVPVVGKALRRLIVTVAQALVPAVSHGEQEGKDRDMLRLLP